MCFVSFMAANNLHCKELIMLPTSDMKFVKPVQLSFCHDNHTLTVTVLKHKQ